MAAARDDQIRLAMVLAVIERACGTPVRPNTFPGLAGSS